MKEVALRAIDYARTAITVCLENNEYRIGLRYGELLFIITDPSLVIHMDWGSYII